MLNKQNQTKYKQLYKQFETAFYKMYDFVELNKDSIEGIEGSVHLIESIDRWGVDVEGCIDLKKFVDWNKYNKENNLA
jgi:hypothetical protein